MIAWISSLACDPENNPCFLVEKIKCPEQGAQKKNIILSWMIDVQFCF